MVIEPDSTRVRGEWLELENDALSGMDQLEGFLGAGNPNNDYERVWISGIDEFGETREGFTYVYKSRGEYPVLLDGVWQQSDA
jgi:gamma-glutamylcyclotransferase (GGCT)/AIG2-like uncharacterized protein YtfP